MMEDGNSHVTFMFQVGLVRDLISVDASQLTLKTMKDLACNFINQRVSETLIRPAAVLGRVDTLIIALIFFFFLFPCY